MQPVVITNILYKPDKKETFFIVTYLNYGFSQKKFPYFNFFFSG